MRYCYCFNYWFKSLYNFNNDRDYGSCKTSITLDTVTSPGCDDYRILCQLGALRGLRVIVLKKYKNKKKDNCLQASSAELCDVFGTGVIGRRDANTENYE